MDGQRMHGQQIDWDELRALANEVCSRAYAPYSNFRVGAAALADTGRLLVGCNVENAAYGVVLCAECGLVSQLHASGASSLVAVAVVNHKGQITLPCGRCRQLLWEHGGAELLVDTPDGPVTMAELLPRAFDAEDLNPTRLHTVGKRARS